MKKNVLLLFCLFLSSCYVNKFDDFSTEFQPKLGSEMWTPIAESPIIIDTTVPYVVHSSTDRVIYIYMNNKNKLIYLEHNPLLNITKQHNISSIITPGVSIKNIVYTEFDSQRVIGLLDNTERFKSYIIHNNFNTSPQYNFSIPSPSTRLYLHFHSANKGNLLHDSGTTLNSFDLIPDADPPLAISSTKVATVGDSYTALSRAGDSLALYYDAEKLKTYNFTDNTTESGGTISAGLTMFIFSLQEANDIWVTTTTSGKMNIYKVRVQNNGVISSTTLIGSDFDTLANGYIAKGAESSSYFLASQNPVDKLIKVIKTTDEFDTMEILGLDGLGSATTEKVNLTSLGGVPYLSYVDNTTKELTILKYLNKKSDQGVFPHARITINSTAVSANLPFSVSGSTSSGNNLTYFWSVSPSAGATIENPTHATTTITLPSSRTKVTLEINNGSRSSKTTQVVTVS